ncbi:MAG: hypothetical protein NTV26_05075 [Caldiserica bacterium]|nr:hypothetical protein [Caldisericota bacterium]
MRMREFSKMGIGTKLTMAMLCWFAVLMAFGVAVRIMPSYTMWKCGAYLAYVGSPVVAAIIVVIALRHYPASRPFLKAFVLVILVATALVGGFYHCATIATHGSLLRAIEVAANTSTGISSSFPSSISPTQVPISKFNAVFYYLLGMVYSPWMPLARVVPVGYLLNLAAMPWPALVLLMLITPRVLAMPVFWLVMLLGILYAVPQQAWVWMKTAAARITSGIKENRNW